MKQIPNLFTLLNLLFGCIAIVLILQTGESIVVLEQSGATQVNLPEKIWLGSLFIFAAAVVDFLDGFLAKALRASSKMGEQLDSLSDVVSFGVAPAMILYQLLRISHAQEENGLNVSIMALLPAFIYTAAAAWRLAKFNISTNQSYGFRGVPTPAAGLLIASFPLITWYGYFGMQTLFINKWFLYAIIILISWLMVSNLPLMALKFKGFGLKKNGAKFTLVGLSLVIIIVLAILKSIWLAWPLIFILYILLSLFYTEKNVAATGQQQTVDLTV